MAVRVSLGKSILLLSRSDVGLVGQFDDKGFIMDDAEAEVTRKPKVWGQTAVRIICRNGKELQFPNPSAAIKYLERRGSFDIRLI